MGRGRRIPDLAFEKALAHLRALDRPFVMNDVFDASRVATGHRYHGAGIFGRLEREGWIELAGPHPNRKNGHAYRLRTQRYVCPTCGHGSVKLQPQKAEANR